MNPAVTELHLTNLSPTFTRFLAFLDQLSLSLFCLGLLTFRTGWVAQTKVSLSEDTD